MHGVADPLLVEPESYWLDTVLLQCRGNVEIQLDLFLSSLMNNAGKSGPADLRKGTPLELESGQLAPSVQTLPLHLLFLRS